MIFNYPRDNVRLQICTGSDLSVTYYYSQVEVYCLPSKPEILLRAPKLVYLQDMIIDFI